MGDLGSLIVSQDERDAAQDVDRNAGLRSDGELVQAASDRFEFLGGFSDVSGLGTEVTVAAYHDGSAYTPEWTNPSAGVPGVAPVSSDPEWRYVPVRRFDDAGDQDVGFHWGEDGLF